jgi:hypothetical protein
MSEQSMSCVFFSLRGFLIVSLLGDGGPFDYDFMINVVFPETGTKIAKQRPQKGRKTMILQVDTASCHHSRQTTAEIERTRICPCVLEFQNLLSCYELISELCVRRCLHVFCWPMYEESDVLVTEFPSSCFHEPIDQLLLLSLHCASSRNFWKRMAFPFPIFFNNFYFASFALPSSHSLSDFADSVRLFGSMLVPSWELPSLAV